MSKKRKAQLIATFITSACIGTEFCVALVCATSGWLIPYALLTVACALTFPSEGPNL